MLFALTLSLLSGLATAVGGAAVFLVRKPSNKLLAASMGFAGGVMLTISLSEMQPHVVLFYSKTLPLQMAALRAVALLLVGVIIAFLIEQLVPQGEQGFEVNGKIDVRAAAIITMIAVVVHNLPEGVLTLFSGYENQAFGVKMALAVALHNLPEGIAIAVPILYATGSRAKGFLFALFSGLCEPLGAVIAFIFLRNYINSSFLNGLISIVAGIMIYVSFSQLIPTSLLFKHRFYTVFGLILGTALISIGIYLF